MTQWFVWAGAVLTLTAGVALVWIWRQRMTLERRMLADEHKQVAAMLAQASERATKIVAEVEGVRADVRASVQQTMNEMTKRMLQAYEEELRAGLQELQKKLAEVGVQEMARLQNSVRKTEAAAKAAAEEKVAALIPYLVRRLAGTSVPVEVHERAVAQAVEEAAAGGLFNDGHEKAK